MQLVLYLLFILMIVVAAGLAGNLKAGVVYSKINAFILSAPHGWILDNQSGISRGIHTVFYPEDSSWENSPVIMYAQMTKKEKGLRSVNDLVRRTIRGFQQHGSPNIKVRKIKTIKAQKNKKGIIYYFRGNQWNSYDAAAYFTEKKSINSIVLHCKSKKDFNDSIESFEALVKSYKPLGNPVDVWKNSEIVN